MMEHVGNKDPNLSIGSIQTDNFMFIVVNHQALPDVDTQCVRSVTREKEQKVNEIQSWMNIKSLAYR